MRIERLTWLLIGIASILFLTIAGAGAASEGAATGDDQPFWPHWRGPHCNGTSDARNLPATWSETQNIIWKTPLPAWSGSSPIVWGDRIFLTSPEKSAGAPAKGAEGGRDPGGERIFLHAFDRATGKELWGKPIGAGNRFAQKHNMASPSPATDGEHVWVMTGIGDFACFDFAGNEIWRRNVEKDFVKFGQMFGYASSPVVWRDRVIIAVLHGWLTDEDSYLLAVDKKTGKDLWRTVRVPSDNEKEVPDSYASPMLMERGGSAVVLMNGGAALTGHDPMTGAEIWRAGGLNPEKSPWFRTISSTTWAGDIVFTPTRIKPFTAVRAGGKGDVTASHVLWRYDRGPDVPTAVSDGKLIWIFDDQGIASCLEAETGKEAYPPKRIATGTYSSSAVLADGKVYITSETGATTVLAAEPEFKILATNQLDDSYTLASPAIAGSRIYLRTSENLYCIGNAK